MDSPLPEEPRRKHLNKENEEMERAGVAIIGAGVAGLSAGCYLQANGYDTRIFEMSDTAGGLCAGWMKNGYQINGGFHSLIGCKPGSDFHRIWRELGIIPRLQFVDFDDFVRFESSDGKTLVLHSDIKRLERHLIELAPEDKDEIGRFIRAARKCLHFQPPTLLKAPELYNPLDGLMALKQVLPHLGLLGKWMRISMRDFSQRFESTVLRELFSSLWFPDSPVFFMLMTLAMMQRREVGYPIGGPLEFSRCLEQRYRELGGECCYRSRVAEVIVENDAAKGVRLEDGSEHRADTTVSAADGRSTIFDLLGGRYLNRRIRGYYSKLPVFPPLLSVSFGLDRAFQLEGFGDSDGVDFPLSEPIMLGDEMTERLGLRLHDFDPCAAPAGKRMARCIINANYLHWEKLDGDRAAYEREKRIVIERVLSGIDTRFPGFSRNVELCDLLTPLSYRRYAGNWRGSHQGWMVVPKTRVFHMKKTLPELADFFMAGQWVEPGGGIPLAAVSGRNLAQIICRRDGCEFSCPPLR